MSKEEMKPVGYFQGIPIYPIASFPPIDTTNWNELGKVAAILADIEDGMATAFWLSLFESKGEQPSMSKGAADRCTISLRTEDYDMLIKALDAMPDEAEERQVADLRTRLIQGRGAAFQRGVSAGIESDLTGR